MRREVELLTQGHTAWQAWCWVPGLLFVNLVPSVADGNMSELHIGINHPVTNIYGELALFQTLYQGSSIGYSFAPHEAFGNVWTHFFSIVQIFYLNLNFSTIIKTEIMRGGRKIKTQTSFGPREPCTGMAVRTSKDCTASLGRLAET